MADEPQVGADQGTPAVSDQQAGDGQVGGGDAPAADKTQAKGDPISEWTDKYNKEKARADEAEKKFGKQTAQVGALKKFTDAIKSDPLSVIKTIMKQSGLSEADLAGKGVDVKKMLEPEGGERTAEAIQASTQDVEKRLLDKVAKLLAPVNEHVLSTRYPDWDNMGDTRDVLNLAVKSGGMQTDELYHLAARGASMQQIIEDAKEEAVAEYVADLNKKGKGQIDPGKRSVQTGEQAAETLNKVLAELGKLPG